MEDNTHTAYQPTQPEPETTPEHAQGEPAMENTLPRATQPTPEYKIPMPAPACCYMSDQSEVWHDVANLQAKTHVHSPTSSMNDVYEAMREKVDRFTDRFDLQPKQKGVLVLKNGEILGLDMLSQPEAYSELHRKIIGSYVMDSAIDEATSTEEWSDEEARAEAFMKEVTGMEGQSHESAGEGTDVRYDCPTLSGTALMHEEQLIHASFLRHDP